MSASTVETPGPVGDRDWLRWAATLLDRPEVVDLFGDRGAPETVARGQAVARRVHSLLPTVDLDNLDDFRRAVYASWICCDFPHSALRQDNWRHLFDLCGYTYAGRSVPRPSVSVPLWRGCLTGPLGLRDNARYTDLAHPSLGWSWSTDADIAAAYAKGRARVAGGRPALYRIDASSDALLAMTDLPGGDRHAKQLVVDTRVLKHRPKVVQL